MEGLKSGFFRHRIFPPLYEFEESGSFLAIVGKQV